MGLFSFLKPPKPVGFTYRPRFYDEKKEEFQERVKRAQGLANGDPDAIKSRISRGLKHKSYYTSDQLFRKKRMARQSNRRLLLIIVVLILLAFWVIEIYLPRIAYLF